MQSAVARVLRVAPMRSTVLIYGESGVGKELVARSIHFNSPRRNKPFIALNCAAMPGNLIESELFGHEKGSFTGAHARVRGKFEIAHQGTLFLDEIGEMDPNTQAKLLRVLEEREFMRVGGNQSIRVDVRVIAATNADLESMVARGTFRRDLYYRLKVVTITVPPLRERREDIPALVGTFLDQLARENAVFRKAITPDALSALQEHSWPGNVRELKNILESVLVSVPGEVIRHEDLPSSVRPSRILPHPMELKAGTRLEDLERELIKRTLEHTGGNRTHSATLLGIGVRTLQRKIRSYGITIPPKRRRPRLKHRLES
jgi:transcriptional regulator with PAS, ATPase and Fis domain